MGSDYDVIIKAGLDVDYSDLKSLSSKLDSILKEYESNKKALEYDSSKKVDSERETKILLIEAAEKRIKELKKDILYYEKALNNIDTATPELEKERTLERIKKLDESILAKEKEYEKVKQTKATESSASKNMSTPDAELRKHEREVIAEREKLSDIENKITASENRQLNLEKEKSNIASQLVAKKKELNGAGSNASNNEEIKTLELRKRSVNESLRAEAAIQKTLQQELETQRDIYLSKKSAAAVDRGWREGQKKSHESKAYSAGVELDELKEELAGLRQKKAALEDEHRLYSEIAKDKSKSSDFDDIKEEKTLKTTLELNHQTAEVARQILKTNELLDTEKERAEVNNVITNEIKRLSERANSANEQGEKGTKRNTAQLYYLVRSMKMLSFSIDNGKRNADKALKSLYKAITLPITAIGKLIGYFNKLSVGLKNIRKSSERTNHGLMMSFKTLLKYTLGIRSLFVLFNRVRAAMIEGLQQMALREAYVNEELSSLYTSLYYMKASVATAVQPLLKSLAPALEYISEAFSKATYYVGSFFATLTGQNFVYKSVRTAVDYAKDIANSTGAASDNLNDAKDNADKLKKQLSGLDKLNVLTTEKDKEKEDKSLKPGYGWEKVPLDRKAVKIAKELKKILGQLFDPIKKAWEKKGKFVMNAWNKALKAIRSLIITIGKDFLKMWADEATEKIFENIFHIIGDILLIVANLAKNFEKAWKANNTGLKILRALRDIIGVIVQGIKDCADYTVKWSKNLSFKPLLNSIASALKNDILPATKNIVDLLEYLYKNILLKIVKDVIEKAIPLLVKSLGNIISSIGNIAKNLTQALNKGNKGVKILTKIEDLFNIVGHSILDASKYTKKWAKNLDFTNLLDSIETCFENLKKPIEAISDAFKYFYENVILEFIRYMTEEGLPLLFDKISEVTKNIDWDKFTSNLKLMFDVLEDILELAWEVFVNILKDLGEAIGKIVASDSFKNLLDKIKEVVSRQDPEKLAKSIEHLVVALWTAKKIFSILGFITNVIVNIGTLINAFNNLAPIISSAFGALSGAVSKIPALIAEIPASFGTLIPAVQTVFGKLVGVITTFGPVVATATLAVFDIKGIEKIISTIDQSLDSYKENQDAFLNEQETYLESYRKLYEEKGKEVADEWAKTCLGIDTTSASFSEAQDQIRAKVEHNWDDVPKNMFDGLMESLKEYFGSGSGILKFLKDFAQNIIDIVKEVLGISSPSKVFRNIGRDIVRGLYNGIKNKFDSVIKNIANIFSSLISKVKSVFGISSPSTKFKSIGANIVQGLYLGIVNKWKSVREYTHKIWTSVLNTARNVLGSAKSGVGRLYNTGMNLVTGLYNGIVEKFNQVRDKLTDMWGTIVSGAQQVFKEHSPSRVFYQIGEYLTEGLLLGVQSDSDDVSKSFEQMVPGANAIKDFSTDFISTLTRMSQESVSIIDSMIESMNESIASLNSLDSLDRMISNMSKLSSIKVPKIAEGFVIPSNVQFSATTNNNQDIDLSQLPDIIKDAVIEALLDPSVMTTEQNDDIIVQIDGKNVFNAVRSQNDIFKKRTGGVSAFA